MKQFVFCLLLGVFAVGCGGYEDPRRDPTKEPDFVDTSDPNVVLGQQAKEREKPAQKKGTP